VVVDPRLDWRCLRKGRELIPRTGSWFSLLTSCRASRAAVFKELNSICSIRAYEGRKRANVFYTRRPTSRPSRVDYLMKDER